ncbi:MAG TPA: DUF1080 domain-containing protein [Sunxiuqinia sp.]|nr:DUF1080 domain-containing protein [Sunxiuqinia sp.]
MRSLFSILVVLAFVFNGSVEAKNPFKLFNLKDLTGWYAFQKEAGKHDNAADLFHVEGHMIRLYGPDAGYLATKKTFKNFELTAEFRWNMDTSYVRKSNHINSGLMYLIPESAKDTLWPKGYQFQIKKGATGDFILLQHVVLTVNGKQEGPGRSVVVKRMLDATNPIGQWNTIHLICKNGKITQELNGKLVNEGNKPSVLEGRIALMYEGFPIDFRKVELKKL